MGRHTADILMVVGKDQAMLNTRSAVLKSAGFHVLRAHDGEQAQVANELVQLRAALICHSFDFGAQDDLAGALWATRQDLVIFKLHQYECEPKRLIAMVQAVIRRDDECITPVTIFRSENARSSLRPVSL